LLVIKTKMAYKPASWRTTEGADRYEPTSDDIVAEGGRLDETKPRVWMGGIGSRAHIAWIGKTLEHTGGSITDLTGHIA
jgi:hypothetical protein